MTEDDPYNENFLGIEATYMTLTDEHKAVNQLGKLLAETGFKSLVNLENVPEFLRVPLLEKLQNSLSNCGALLNLLHTFIDMHGNGSIEQALMTYETMKGIDELPDK